MRFVEDRGVGAVEDERLQGFVVVAAFLAAREEFAVGEGPGAPFAEGVVRVGLDGFVAVDPGDVALALEHRLAAFQDDGPQPRFDQPQRCEQPRGSRSDHDHLGFARHRRIVEVHGSGLRLAVDVDLEREIDLDLPLPCVGRTFHDAHQCHLFVRNAHAPRSERGVELRIGGLFGGEDEREGLRHGGRSCFRAKSVAIAKVYKNADISEIADGFFDFRTRGGLSGMRGGAAPEAGRRVGDRPDRASAAPPDSVLRRRAVPCGENAE